MGTRATIEIKDECDTYYVYRGHDGFPDVVLPDIEKVLAVLKRKGFRSPEASHVTTVMIGELYEPNKSVPNYDITSGWHGDESYRYLCIWNDETKQYEAKLEGL